MSKIRYYSAKRRRAIYHGEDIAPVAIYERDLWVCQICHMSVDSRLRNPHPESATIDHIEPLSQGGEHAEYNMRLAHKRCNEAKGCESW